MFAPEAKALSQRLWRVWRLTRIVDNGWNQKHTKIKENKKYDNIICLSYHYQIIVTVALDNREPIKRKTNNCYCYWRVTRSVDDGWNWTLSVISLYNTIDTIINQNNNDVNKSNNDNNNNNNDNNNNDNNVACEQFVFLGGPTCLTLLV